MTRQERLRLALTIFIVLTTGVALSMGPDPVAHIGHVMIVTAFVLSCYILLK